LTDLKSSGVDPNLFNYSLSDLEALLVQLKEPKFRAAQLFEWIWKHKKFSFDEMTNLAKSLREKLKNDFVIVPPKLLFSENSEDGTKKFLIRLSDSKTVETVWIPKEDQGRVTVCISTQVGCRMGCKFCLTAQQKTERDLSPGEIAGQLFVLPDSDKITNVVVMGMGEPFDNLDNLLKALTIIQSPNGMGIGAGKITVSTSGLVPAIHRFVRESKCRLAVSLNASNDIVRSEIMPINKAYPLKVLMGALKEIASRDYPRLRRKDFLVTFEYILMEGLNDSPESARELISLVRGVPCKINLLLYNENPNTPYKRPSAERVDVFQKILMSKGLLSFVRKSRGRDISAACGQLASQQKRQTLGASSLRLS
jgi:23S rRNA (adenine2503-C2)-methyltransferase